jgi:hypothetical protein
MGSVPSPLSSGDFLAQPLLQLSCSKFAGCVLPLLPSPIGLFIYSSMRDCPSPLFGAQGTPPSLLCVSFLLLFIIQFGFFSIFSLGGGQSVQGDMLIWPRVVCGSTVCCLAHLWSASLKPVGAGVWQHVSPPGFSVYHGVEMLCVGWGCGGVGVLPLLGGFTVRCISSIPARFYFRKHAFCFLPLVAILESLNTTFS